LPCDPQKETCALGLQLFRRQIKIKRLSGLQFHIKIIAFFDKLVGRSCPNRGAGHHECRGGKKYLAGKVKVYFHILSPTEAAFAPEARLRG
jgi:hypothetical protein